MRKHAWLGWLIAFSLAVAMLAPVAGVVAQVSDEDVDPVVTEEVVTGEEETTENTPVEESLVAASDVQIAAASTITMRASVGGNPLPGVTFRVFTDTGAACTPQVGVDQATKVSGETTFSTAIDDQNSYCIELAGIPSGYELTGDSVGHFADGFIYKGTTDLPLDWTVTFAQLPTADLHVFKVDPENNRVGGAAFTVYAGSCGPTGDPVAGPLFVNDATQGNIDNGSAGRVIFPDLLVGEYCVVESTVPDGYHPATGPLNATLAEDGDGVSFVNEPILLGDLKVTKYFCPSTQASGIVLNPEFIREDCEPGETEFYIYPFGDSSGEPLGPFYTDASTGELLVQGLPATDTLPHALYETAAEVNIAFDIEGGETTELVVLNYYNPNGTLKLFKYYCAVDKLEDERTEILVFKPEVVNISGGEVEGECSLGAADFEIWPFQVEADKILISVDWTGNLVLPLPAGTHAIKEVGSGEAALFTIYPEQTTYIDVYNYVYDKGTVHVIKYFCTAHEVGTDIYVGEPGYHPDLGNVDLSHCWKGKADFEIWPFGDWSAAIGFSTGHHGEKSLVVPVTGETPHAIKEKGSHEAASFNIEKGKTTTIKVVNYVKYEKPVHPEKPGDPHKPGYGEDDKGGVYVDTLPSTGAGNGAQNSLLLLALSAAATLGLGGLVLRRRLLI